jgi:hypothetical protein
MYTIYCSHDICICVRINLLMCVRVSVVFMHGIMNNVDAGYMQLLPSFMNGYAQMCD